MVRFDQDLLLSHLVQTGALRAETIDQLAEFLADFHGRVEQATAIDRHGLAELAAEASEANFRYLATTLEDPAERAELEALRDWSQRRYLAIETELRNRKRNGFVRECHGDLHLDNIVLIEDRPILFDGIEFNAQLRWIDVINELAFPVMDLEANGAPGHAYRLLNRYLELTGDYRGLILFDFFRLYRAMVRAKVALITETTRVSELDRPPPHGVCHRYLAYGSALIQRASPYLVLMHGYSGSGKSFVSQQLSQVLPAIRLRSDVERKRLAGLTAETRSRDDLAKSLYGPEMSAKTYAQLAAFAQLLLTVGHSVIVDATFLDHRQRAAFHGIAHSLGLGFAVVDCRATPEVLAARLTARNRSGRDPSDADLSVLAQQMEFAEPLSNSEMPWVVAVDTTTQLSAIDLAKAIAKIPQPL
jgi:predicted kinase